MDHLQNLHTHTTYCDGVDTPEEMIRYALEKGFDSLGFSGHSYMSYSAYKKISLESTEAYKREVTALKRRYQDRIKLYLGLEVDMYSDVDLSGYDYLIGSVHYLKKDGVYHGFDRGADEVKRLIDTQFGGDGTAFAKAYYEAVAELPAHGEFDIIGHFDLITKNLEIAPLFDDQSDVYLNAALEAMEALKGKIPFFEVNSGAVARGYRTAPYPAVRLMKELKKMGFGAIITSDCHDGRLIDCGFELAGSLLAESGFREKYVLTDSGFEAVSL